MAAEPVQENEHKSAQIDIKTSSTNLKLKPLNRSTNWLSKAAAAAASAVTAAAASR